MSKLVSVIIPTYKRPETLSRAINSILNQSYQNFEVIIVDDNSPDFIERTQTEKVMEKYLEDSRIKYIKHAENKNGSAARNTGFKSSNGEYIMLLDDDDEFFPDKIKAQLECLENKDETWGACYTPYIRVKNNKLYSKSKEKREGNLLIEQLKRNLFVAAGSNLMIRRSVYTELGGFDETFPRNQDQEFLARLLLKYKIAYSDVLGLKVHVHVDENRKSVDFDKISEQYLNAFESIISTLKEEDKESIYRMINLQRLRMKIIGFRKWNEVAPMFTNKEVKLNDTISYFTHLLYRKISKTCFGFESNKFKIK